MKCAHCRLPIENGDPFIGTVTNETYHIDCYEQRPAEPAQIIASPTITDRIFAFFRPKS